MSRDREKSERKGHQSYCFPELQDFLEGSLIVVVGLDNSRYPFQLLLYDVYAKLI